jgi:hypothetical protein
LSQKLSTITAPKLVQIQLHWIDYFQGKWSKRISSDVKDYLPIYVDDAFVPERDIYIHVAKETDQEGNEGALLVVLERRDDKRVAFRITSKNCTLVLGVLDYYGEFTLPKFPYDTKGVDATFVTGTGNLTASFETHIGSSGDAQTDTEKILSTTNDYALLMCGNRIAPPFLRSTDPLYWQAGDLVSPFFFKDTTNPNADSQSKFFDDLTFFVQPSLTEATMGEWDGWAIVPSTPGPNSGEIVDGIDVQTQFPVSFNVPVNPPDPVYSKYSLQTREDWATNQATAISFGNSYVGKSGGLVLGKTSVLARGFISPVSGLMGSALTGGIATKPTIVLVGGQGLRSGQVQSLKGLPRSNVGNIGAFSNQINLYGGKSMQR